MMNDAPFDAPSTSFESCFAAIEQTDFEQRLAKGEQQMGG
jgi:hypothetical protein